MDRTLTLKKMDNLEPYLHCVEYAAFVCGDDETFRKETAKIVEELTRNKT